MNQEIEVSGTSVDEAVSAGLKKLGLNRSQVNIEVVDEGRRAILGIGGRDAVVKLSAKIIEKPVEPPPKPAAPITPVQPVIEEPTAAVDEEEVKSAPDTAVLEETRLHTDHDDANENEAQIAGEVVSQLLELMDVKASLDIQQTDRDDLTGKKLPLININGDDLGVLIGSRGETLDSLQYISRLIVGHKIRQRASFVIDVEGYRQRREQALSRLAERMADKAVKRGSPVTLEAMPAYERRIIHMALRDSKKVRTESTGEGNRRRVRIYPN